MNANDFIDWSQPSLGGDGAPVSQTFSAMSNGGLSIGGSLFGGTGQICDTSYDSCSFAFTDYYGIWADNNGYNSGTGPVTLSFPSGISGLGSTIASNYTVLNGAYQFSASLSLYDNSTLLGTVTGTSDSNGDPFYLGAIDATGADITSAVFSITGILFPATQVPPSTGETSVNNAQNYTPSLPPGATVISTTFTDYAECVGSPNPLPECAAENVDCSTLGLYCPRKCACGGSFNGQTISGLPPEGVPVGWNVQYEYQAPGYTIPASTDTNASDIGDLYLDSVDLDTNPVSSSAPEPHALHLLGAGAVLAAALLRKRLLSHWA